MANHSPAQVPLLRERLSRLALPAFSGAAEPLGLVVVATDLGVAPAVPRQLVLVLAPGVIRVVLAPGGLVFVVYWSGHRYLLVVRCREEGWRDGWVVVYQLTPPDW